jgi:hypothetical protein
MPNSSINPPCSYQREYDRRLVECRFTESKDDEDHPDNYPCNSSLNALSASATRVLVQNLSRGKFISCDLIFKVHGYQYTVGAATRRSKKRLARAIGAAHLLLHKILSHFAKFVIPRLDEFFRRQFVYL